MRYDLVRLGWFQFQQLCDVIVETETGVPPAAWTGEADRRRETVVESEVTVGGLTLPPPVVVGSVFVRDSVAPAAVVERVAGPARAAEYSVLLLTNAPLTELGRGHVAERAGSRVAVLDGAALSDLLDRRPDLRMRFPSVLGLRTLDGWIDPDVMRRSTLDVAAAQALACVFAPTQAHAATVDVLRRRRFAVLTGPPEMGKTAIARMVALARLADGWEAHECSSPDHLARAFDASRPQIFVADDAFGSTEYRPDTAERWASELPHLLRRLDDTHWLLWTSRPTPLHAGLARLQRERGLERFPVPSQVQVDAARFSPQEKALVLFRHARAAPLSIVARHFVQAHGATMVAHRHFTPERIRRFVGGLPDAAAAGLLAGRKEADLVVRAALGRPTEAMRASFAALGRAHRALLLAMLDQPPGPVAERDLVASMREIDPGAHPEPHGLADRLHDHFLRPHGHRLDWVHPSWRDVVIDHLAEHGQDRRGFLSGCGVDGVLLAVSTGGGPAGERVRPLLRDDADYDELGARFGPLLREADDRDRTRVLHGLCVAFETAQDGPAVAELAALAFRALVVTRSCWDRAEVPVTALAAWHALAADLVPPPRPAPDPRRTWVALLPAGPVALGQPEQLDRLADWLSLAGVLDRHAPGRLVDYGFPARQLSLLDSLIDTVDLRAHDLPAEVRGRVAEIMRSIEALVPALADRAGDAARVLEWLGGLPDDPSPPDPAPELPFEFTLDVDRILSDLD